MWFCKLDKLKIIKKSMLENCFPKNGEKIPKFRFDGFCGDWEQRKVSELCSISTGKSNTQDKVEDVEYPFYVRSPIIERSTKYLYDEEAVLTVGDGVGTGKVFHYVNGKYDLHQRCYRMYDFTDEFAVSGAWRSPFRFRTVGFRSITAILNRLDMNASIDLGSQGQALCNASLTAQTNTGQW